MIAFDADVAGTNANLRGIDLAWQAGFNVKVIHLPVGMDPDDIIKESPEKWQELVREARNFMDYIFEVTFADLDIARVDHKKLAAKKILPLIAKLGDEVEKFHYVKKLATILSIAEEILLNTLKGLKHKIKEPEKVKKEQVEPINQEKATAEQLLSLLLKFPEQMKLLVQHLKPEEISYQPAANLYKELIIYYNKDQKITEEGLVSNFNKEQADYLNQLSLYVDKSFFEEKPDLINYEISQLINRLKGFYIKKRLQKIGQELEQAEKEDNKQKVEQLGEEFTKLTRQLNQI